MLKRISLALALSAALPTFAAPTSGDLMFTAFNADEDGWAMVTFVDLAPSTVVYFSDNEWNGSAIGSGGAFNGGESFHQWNTGGSTIAAGTVIRFSAIDSATNLAASIGSLTRATVSGSTNYGTSQSADTIYAYLGSSATAPTTFLSAISSGGFSATEGQLLNTGLGVGVSAVQLGNATDFAEYVGARTGQLSMADYKPLVANGGNWNDLGDGSFATRIPDTTVFAPIPEPSTYLMILAGVPLLMGLARRRQQQKR